MKPGRVGIYQSHRCFTKRQLLRSSVVARLACMRIILTMWSYSLLAIAIYVFYRYVKSKRSYFDDLGVPCVPGPPLLGNMFKAFVRMKHITEATWEWYITYPEAKYVGGFDFMKPNLMVRDPELIKTITIKHFDSFPNHEQFADPEAEPLFGGNLFSITGDKWKEARNLLTPAFTTSKMKAMHELMIDCVKNFVGYLSQLPEDSRKMLATKDLFTKFTNDAIATCAFGISVDSVKDPNNDFYVLGSKATNFDGLVMIKFMFYRVCPKIMKWLGIRLFSKRVSDFFEDIVRKTVQMREEKGISRPDMIQLMMNARGKTSKNLKLDVTEMTAQAFIFFFGGFDSTSTQMCTMAHELAINPDIQKRLQDEIDDIMTRCDGSPSYDDIQGMPYLDAIFTETLRQHTPFAFLDRSCVKAFELPPALPGGKPFTVPVGMTVIIPSSSIHRDPKYHVDPTKFDPDRYYEKKVTINDVTNLGFGIGPRSCIGNRFAILETKILFFYMLSKFTLVANEKTCNPLVYSKDSFNIKPVGGFWLGIEPRT